MTEVDIDGTRQRVDNIMQEFTRQDKKLAIKYDLTPALAKLLLLLIELPFVTNEIFIASGIMKTGPKQAMARLRKYMKPHDITIESNRTKGYWLTQETKDGIS